MPTAWRIVKKKYAEAAFDGEGARRYGGRWNSPGRNVVYAAQSRALALLEMLAGLRSVKPVASYVLVPVSFPDSVLDSLIAEDLPDDWRNSPPSSSIQRIGDLWLDGAQQAVLQVPSVIVPEEYNFLINPAHPDFAAFRIGEPEIILFDPRLLP